MATVNVAGGTLLRARTGALGRAGHAPYLTPRRQKQVSERTYQLFAR